MPVKYQPITALNCVTAKYRLSEKQNKATPASLVQPLLRWLRYSPNQVGIDVFNYANTDRVNGPPQIGNLSAVILDPIRYPGQLLVGPSFLPRLLWGPYWVIAAGGKTADDGYEWAVVSGGPPKLVGKTGYCKTGNGTNDSGLWIFTAEPIVNAAMIEQLRQIAQGMGFDTSVLVPVNQAGCKYSNIQQV
jgi:lipocalin